MGDFNLPDFNWHYYTGPNNPIYESFLKFVNNHGLSQFVHAPSHKNSNILDLILGFDGFINDLTIECPLSTSDHFLICFNLNQSDSSINKNNESFSYNYNKADYYSIKAYLATINWYQEFSYAFTVEDYWSIFSNHLNEAISLYVPQKRCTAPPLPNRRSYF